MSDQASRTDNELGLFYLFDLLRRGWFWLVGGAILGCAGAYGLVATMAPTYQAQVLVRIGTVAKTILEPASTTVERINSPAFRLEVAQASNDQQLLRRLSRKAGSDRFMSASLIRDSQLVSLVVHAASTDQARTLGVLALEAIQQRHETMTAALVDKARSDIEVLKDKLKLVEQELAALAQSRAQTSSRDAMAIGSAALLTNLQLERRGEITSLREDIAGMEFALLPPATMPTAAIEPIFVGEDPVSPRLIPWLVVGMLGGLLMGVAVAVAREWWPGRSGPAVHEGA